MFEISKYDPVVRLFVSDMGSIEGTAIEQLEKAAQLKGVETAVGMPDLHPGKGCPVGAAFLSEHYVYPYLIGNDIGCGMGFWETNLKKHKTKKDKWIKKLSGSETFWDESFQDLIVQNNLDPLSARALGTIGGGNHFVELQVLEKVYKKTEFEKLGLNKSCLYLLVHTGSRGIGEMILRQHTDRYGAGSLSMESADGGRYLQQHDKAVRWARLNRSIIANGFTRKVGGGCHRMILDTCHNSLTRVKINKKYWWLHRKGLSPSDEEIVVIPGSRGAFTYLVRPLGSQEVNLWSLPHGAGRKWNRKSCKGRLKDSFTKADLSRTSLGSRVICNEKNALFEEAPQAYKNIERIIKDLRDQGLVEVIASFRPLITFK